MNSVKTDRTRLYEQFHSFDKYHSGLYHRIHDAVRTIFRKLIPLRRRTAF